MLRKRPPRPQPRKRLRRPVPSLLPRLPSQPRLPDPLRLQRGHLCPARSPLYLLRNPEFPLRPDLQCPLARDPLPPRLRDQPFRPRNPRFRKPPDRLRPQCPAPSPLWLCPQNPHLPLPSSLQFLRPRPQGLRRSPHPGCGPRQCPPERQEPRIRRFRLRPADARNQISPSIAPRSV